MSRGMYPDADPTAPGGMSQPELIAELTKYHGYTKASAKALSWREQIDAVCQGRLDREAEAKAEQAEEPFEDGIWDDLDEDVPQPEASAEEYPHCSHCAHDHPAHPDGAHTNGCGRTGCKGNTPGAESDVEDDLWSDDEDDDEDDSAYLLAPAAEFAESDDMGAAEEIALFMDAQTEAAAERKATSLFKPVTGTLDYIFDGHAGASPSGSERWMHCTASLGASRRFLETLTPNQQIAFARSSTAARQGTTAHAAAEVEVGVMMGTVEAEEAENALLELTVLTDEEGDAYDEEMAEHISEYVDFVKQLHDAGRPLLIEQRVTALVPLTGMHEGEVHGIPGSGDCIGLPSPEEKVLTVADLKYGDGIDVSVEANPQVRIYALGALGEIADAEGNLPDLDHIEYAIVQPRLGGIKVWSESVDDLLTWRDEVLAPALTAALYGVDEGATYAPSESACQFCPARGSCAALADQRVEQAADLFDVLIENGDEFPETGTLSDTRLGELLLQVMALDNIKDDLKAEAERRLHRGGSVPGFELVSYTPPRKWTENAMSEIEHDPDVPALYKPKALLTPKQALTLLGKEGEAKIGHLIESPAKRPVIAKVDRGNDRRKTWEGKPPEDMFTEIVD